MSRWKIKSRIKAKRKSPECREQAEGSGPQLITGGLSGWPFSTTIQPVSRADLPALNSYFRAHELLPLSYVFDPQQEKCRRIVAIAAKLLKDPKASKKELTRAIVILGHSPTPSAIEALDRMSEAGHRLSSMARMALDECLGMAADEGLLDSLSAREMN